MTLVTQIKIMKSHIALCVSSTFLFSSLAFAQGGTGVDLIYQWDGVEASDYLGQYVSDAGDVDGDGFDDVIVAAPYSGGGLYGYDSYGAAFVYSGATGAVLHRFDAAIAGTQFAKSVAGPGDVNGDGFDDILFGAHNHGVGGAVFVYSGADGTLLFQLDSNVSDGRYGEVVAAVGDVNVDGFADFLVSDPNGDPIGLNRAGTVYLYSGATGALLMQFDGQVSDTHFGQSISGAGDVNADGIPDVIIGGGNLDFANVYSGATGNLLYQLTEVSSFGRSVAGIGDIDGDGADDLLVGAPLADTNYAVRAGSVFAYSGATGTVLFRLDGQSNRDEFGYSVADAGDITGDGVSDILVGAAYATPNGLFGRGAAYIYSGATGLFQIQINGSDQNTNLGLDVSTAGDVNGDGLADIVVGEFGAAPNGISRAGSAYVYSFGNFDPYLSISASSISSSAGGQLDFNIDFPAAQAGLYYTLLASMDTADPWTHNGVEVPLSPYAFLQTMMFNPSPVFQQSRGTLDFNGDGHALAIVPPGMLASHVGSQFWFAAIAYSTGRNLTTSSTAISLDILP